MRDNEPRPESRMLAYDLVDGERDYQNEKWGEMDGVYPLTVGGFGLLLEEYAAKARAIWAQEPKPEVKTMEEIRKVAAIAVFALEVHSAAPRRMLSKDTAHHPLCEAAMACHPDCKRR